MKTVSRFEANLLHILQAFLQRAPRERALTLIMEEHAAPPCLSRAAVELVQDHLGKGCIWLLARGGWRRERHVHAGQVRAGRLWQRTDPGQLGLAFSRNSLEFLIWITAVNPGDAQHPWRPRLPELTIGDRLLFFLAFQTLREFEAGKELLKHPYFSQDGLCRLAFPEEFAKVNEEPDWAPWLNGIGACILEALQTWLTERWLQIERRKEQITTWQRMRACGRAQERVLRSFLDAVHQAGRWDLARFLLRSLALLLRGRPGVQSWIRGLDVRTLRLADRQETYRAALALVRQAERLRQWEREARSIGYFDEGYAASQLWKADWETHHGEELAEHAQMLPREIEPLKP